MSIEVKTTCPLGHQCETVKDGAIHRCAWYIEVHGAHPQTGEVSQEKGCAITWMPRLTLEVARTNRGQTAAIESFRNEMAEGNRQFLGLAGQALTLKELSVSTDHESGS
jgi:hypothetical protein